MRKIKMIEAREKLNPKNEFSKINTKWKSKRDSDKDLEDLKNYVNQLYEKQLKNE